MVFPCDVMELPGVIHLGDSYQCGLEPRLVPIGHWDLPRLNMRMHFFGAAEDEVLARVIGLSQQAQRWVAVTWPGLLQMMRLESQLPRPSLELVEDHADGEMSEPDLTRFPVHTLWDPKFSDHSILEGGFCRLLRMEGVVGIHNIRSDPAVAILPTALNRIRGSW